MNRDSSTSAKQISQGANAQREPLGLVQGGGLHGNQPANNSVGDFFHFDQIFSIIKLWKKLIIAICFIAALGTLIADLLSFPVYTATSILSISSQQSSSASELIFSAAGGSKSSQVQQIQEYLRFLNSDSFFLSLAESLKFDEDFANLNLTRESEISPLNPFFWKNFNIRQVRNHDFSKERSYNDPMQIRVEQLTSILKEMILFTSDQTSVISVKATTLDPKTSMVIANTAAKEFSSIATKHDQEELTQLQEFMKDKIAESTVKIKKNEIDLIEFKKQHNIVATGGRSAILSEQLRSIESQLESNQLSHDQNDKMISYYEKWLTKIEQKSLQADAAGADSEATPDAITLKQEFDDLHRQKLLLQSQGYTENDWRFKKVTQAINQLALRMKTISPPGQQNSTFIGLTDPRIARAKIKELKEQNQQLETKIATLNVSRASLTDGLKGVPQAEVDMLRLTRGLELEFDAFSTLKKKLNQLEIQQISTKKTVKIEEPATMPKRSMKTSLYLKLLFSVLIGLFIGCMSAIILESTNPTVKSRMELEEMHINVLGEIPHITSKHDVGKIIDLNTSRTDLVVCREATESIEAMAFKYIRARLTGFRDEKQKPIKIIAITSPENGDGKSLVSANLAVAISQIEKKTLLIDADLRKPSQPWYFDYQKSDGLATLLALKSFLDDVIMKDVVHNLDILPTGTYSTNNSTEILGGKKFKILIKYLKQHYDCIVIDCPPANAMVDAAIVGGITDCVILVTNYRKTKKERITSAYRKLHQISRKPVYGILNNVVRVDEFLSYYAYPYVMAKMEIMKARETEKAPGEIRSFHEKLRAKNQDLAARLNRGSANDTEKEDNDYDTDYDTDYDEAAPDGIPEDGAENTPENSMDDDTDGTDDNDDNDDGGPKDSGPSAA